MNDKWEPFELALDILIVFVSVFAVVSSHGKYQAGFVDYGDIAWALFYMFIFSISVIDLYDYYKEVKNG